MAPIRILHASDLHLAHKERQRSFPDKFRDGLREALRGMQAAAAPESTFFAKLGATWSNAVARASSYDVSILKRFAEFVHMEVENERLDGVIITGDVATSGDVRDIDRVDKVFNQASDPELPFLGAFSQQASLAFITPPAIFLKFFAGNHDRFVRSNALGRTKWWRVPLLFWKVFDAGGKEFDRIRFNNDPAHKTLPVEVFHTQKRQPNGRMLTVWILMADFTLKTFDEHEKIFGWLAQGKVDDDTLKVLVAQTKIVKENTDANTDQCILWACHFPPFFPGVKRSGRLLGGENLIKDANDLGVKAILTGHTHEQLKYSKPGMTEILCCGTTTQFEPGSMPGGKFEEDLTRGNLLQVLEIDLDGNGKVSLDVENYRYMHSASLALGGIKKGQSGSSTGWERIYP